MARTERWQEVLLGNLNIECINIGVMCGIYKKNYDQNLREIHIALSNFGYKYQALQKRERASPKIIEFGRQSQVVIQVSKQPGKNSHSVSRGILKWQ